MRTLNGGKTLAIGSDHAGFELKEHIKRILDELKVEYDDVGTDSAESCDYPDFARQVADLVSQGKKAQGILCCGSGVGVSVVANKVRGVRAALCHTEEGVKLARQHNNANVLCLGARTQDPALLKAMIESFLATEFEGGRHARRVDKIEKWRQGESDPVWEK